MFIFNMFQSKKVLKMIKMSKVHTFTWAHPKSQLLPKGSSLTC